MTPSPLIPPHDLQALRSSAADLVILDARPGPADYAAGHLEEARHADLDTQLSAASDPGADPAQGGRHPLPPLDRWLRQLGEWGIGPESEVVIYDSQSGANAAARAWWMLRAVGHERVRVLDGDFRHGGPLTTEVPSIAGRPSYPADHWQRPVAELRRVDELRRDPDWRVLDVRASLRFLGRNEPIDPIAGHIPGAINLPFSENLGDGGRFKPPSELRTLYEALFGGTSPDHVIVHCGSGVTACHTLLALEAAGLEGASLYVGSWSEWCRNDLPLDVPRE